MTSSGIVAGMSQNGAVWIDLTNSPHVLFFRPIVRRMADAGVETVITARDFAQTLGLLRLYDMPHTVIGRHGGARMAGKVAGLARRSSSLVAWSQGKRLRQAASHGSNDLAVAARMRRLHSTVAHDYEGASTMHHINFRLAGKVMMPDVLPFEELARYGLTRAKYRPYAGIKEQVSLADFAPDLSVLRTLRLDESRVVAVLRPPATMSLYHRGISNELFGRAVDHLLAEDVQVVLLPRTPAQGTAFAGTRGITIPEKPVDGPSLVYLADLVISAGGTMNREAALLGTPTWTTFAGSLGAVDRTLVQRGLMRVLERPDQLLIEKHEPKEPTFEALADAVTEEILRM
jgi:predicted glycosyltransferase